MAGESIVTANSARILVVDDDVLSRRLVEFPLQKDGHTVFTAASGRKALEVVEREPVDLIFLDLLMDDMDGAEVLEVLQDDERFRDIPVVVITGIGDAEAEKECTAAGAREFLRKPTTAAVLREIVADLLGLDMNASVAGAPDSPAAIPEPNAADAPALDPAPIKQLRSEYDDAATAEFISRFQELSHTQRNAVAAAVSASEWDQLRRATNDIKGGARTLGLTRLAALRRDIERACTEDRADDARQAAGDLGQRIDEALAALNDHTATLGLGS